MLKFASLSLLLIITLSLTAPSKQANGAGFNCHYYNNDAHKYFDILALRSSFTRSQTNIPITYKDKQYTATVNYNFCKNIAKPDTSCPTPSSGSTSGYIFIKEISLCFPLTDILNSKWENQYLKIAQNKDKDEPTVYQTGVEFMANNSKHSEAMPFNFAYKVLCPLE